MSTNKAALGKQHARCLTLAPAFHSKCTPHGVRWMLGCWGKVWAIRRHGVDCNSSTQFLQQWEVHFKISGTMSGPQHALDVLMLGLLGVSIHVSIETLCELLFMYVHVYTRVRMYACMPVCKYVYGYVNREISKSICMYFVCCVVCCT